MSDNKFVLLDTVHTGRHWVNVDHVVSVEAVSDTCCRVHLTKTIDVAVLGGRREKRSSLQVAKGPMEVTEMISDRMHP